MFNLDNIRDNAYEFVNNSIEWGKNNPEVLIEAGVQLATIAVSRKAGRKYRFSRNNPHGNKIPQFDQQIINAKNNINLESRKLNYLYAEERYNVANCKYRPPNHDVEYRKNINQQVKKIKENKKQLKKAKINKEEAQNNHNQLEANIKKESKAVEAFIFGLGTLSYDLYKANKVEGTVEDEARIVLNDGIDSLEKQAVAVQNKIDSDISFFDKRVKKLKNSDKLSNEESQLLDTTFELFNTNSQGIKKELGNLFEDIDKEKIDAPDSSEYMKKVSVFTTLKLMSGAIPSAALKVATTFGINLIEDRYCNPELTESDVVSFYKKNTDLKIKDVSNVQRNENILKVVTKSAVNQAVGTFTDSSKVAIFTEMLLDQALPLDKADTAFLQKIVDDALAASSDQIQHAEDIHKLRKEQFEEFLAKLEKLEDPSKNYYMDKMKECWTSAKSLISS